MGNPDDDGQKKEGDTGADEPVDPYGKTCVAIPTQGDRVDQYLRPDEQEEPDRAESGQADERKPNPVFEGVSGAMRAREDTIAARLLETVRPARLSHIPGARILALLQVDRVNMWPISRKWRVIHVSFPDADTEKLKNMIRIVKSANGEIISLPFQDPDQTELLAVFPNKHRAEKALYVMHGKYGDELGMGMQGDGGVYCGIVEGAPCFIDKGIDEALADSAEPHMPMVDREDRTFEADVSEDNIKGAVLQIPSDITKIGAVMEIRIPNYFSELDREQKSRLLFALFSIIDRKTDVLEWIGSTMRIVSTRERAAAMLVIQVKAVLEKFPEANFQVAVSEGAFEVLGLGEDDGPPRTLRGEMFREVRELGIPEGERGIFATQGELGRLSTPRGLKINETARTEYGTVKLVDVEDRTTEIRTGGPKYMVGRFEEIKSFIEKAGRVGRRGGVSITVLDGEPGIGKSRFMEESEKILRNRSITDKIVCSKANEYEREKPHTFARRVVEGMVSAYSGLSDSENYRILECFAGGERGDDELAEKVGILHDHPEELVRRMRELVQSSREVFALFLDDLQWCDAQSAVVIAAFINALENDDKMILELSARNDYQEMPLEIKRALDAKGADAIHLKALPFISDSEPTDLLRQYILESPQFCAATDRTLPESFLVNVGTRCGGNPYALTRMLYDLEEDGKIYIDDGGRIIVRESDIDYDDYEAAALYANRVSRLDRDEQTVCKALILFGGNVSMNVFRRIFPELVQYAHKLEEHGLICTEPCLRFQHDLIRKAAEDKFEMDPKLAWEVYVKLHPLSENQEFAGEITHAMQFRLVRQSMMDIGGMAIHEAALDNGKGAVFELEAEHRMTEALETIRFLQERIADIPAALRFHFEERMSHILLRLGNARECIEHIRAARNIAEADPEAAEEWEKLLDLRILECDARYLQNLNEWRKYIAEMRTAIDDLAGEVGNAHRRQGLNPLDHSKITKGEYLVRLNEARHAYCAGAMRDALHLCSMLVADLEGLRGVAAGRELPIEYEKVLIEAKRFYIALIMQREEWMMSRYDEDMRFSQVGASERQEDLERAYDAQRSVYDIYTKSPHKMRHPKDLVTTLLAAAKLEVFMGRSKDDAMEVLHEAARRAGGFQEVRLLTSIHQMRGDLCMSYPDIRTNMSRTDGAIRWYKTGMSEMRQLGKEGENDQYYAFNACNCGRAIAIQVEAFGGKDNAAKSKIREGLGYAFEPLGIIGDQNAIGQYIFPTIGKLLELADRTGIQDGITIPESITKASVENAITLLESKLAEAARNGAEECVLSELNWKLSGLWTLSGRFAG